MKKYLTPPFWLLMAIIVAVWVNIGLMFNGFYSESVAGGITRVIGFGGLAVVALMYKLRPEWVPTTIKARAAKARKDELKRAARGKNRRRPDRPTSDTNSDEPRRPSGW